MEMQKSSASMAAVLFLHFFALSSFILLSFFYFSPVWFGGRTNAPHKNGVSMAVESVLIGVGNEKKNISYVNVKGEVMVSRCDVTQGEWVANGSYPLYDDVSCPFIDEGFSCQKNGRKDFGFLKWRWQPRACSIPRMNYYQEGRTIHPYLNASSAFRKALTTWSSWVDSHVDPNKTLVFFRNYSPSHFRGGQWNTGGSCKEATGPITDVPLFIYPEKNMIIEDVLRLMRTPVTILNITTLSGPRIDSHPSIYGGRGRAPHVEDCSHWCLPGLPDTWNELLYFHLKITIPI